MTFVVWAACVGAGVVIGHFIGWTGREGEVNTLKRRLRASEEGCQRGNDLVDSLTARLASAELVGDRLRDDLAAARAYLRRYDQTLDAVAAEWWAIKTAVDKAYANAVCEFDSFNDARIPGDDQYPWRENRGA